MVMNLKTGLISEIYWNLYTEALGNMTTGLEGFPFLFLGRTNLCHSNGDLIPV